MSCRSRRSRRCSCASHESRLTKTQAGQPYEDGSAGGALDYDTFVPNSAPTPAVAAIARAPQSVTRPAPTHGDAPPAPAASAPRPARQKSDTADTASATLASGASITMRIGIAAPIENVAADANAACSG